MKSKVQFLLATLNHPDQLAAFSFFKKMTTSDFARKVIETLLTRVMLIAIGLVTSVIVARILGPEGRGIYAVACTAGALVVQFGNMGLHASNSYYISRNRKLLLPLLSNTVFVALIVGCSLPALAIVGFSLYPNLAPVEGPLLVLVLVWVPFGLGYLLLQNLLIGIQDIRAYNIIEVGNRILSVLLMSVLISIKWVTVESVYMAGFIALIVSIVWVFFKLRVSIFSFPAPSFPLFLENIRYGIKAYLAALFAYIMFRIDLIMVKYILGAVQAGYYSVAVSVADMVYMLPAVVGTIIFPETIGHGK